MGVHCCIHPSFPLITAELLTVFYNNSNCQFIVDLPGVNPVCSSLWCLISDLLYVSEGCERDPYSGNLSVIPCRLLQSHWSPIPIQRGMTKLFNRSWGMAARIACNLHVLGSPPALSKSAGMSQIPSALPPLSMMIAFLTSVGEGGSFRMNGSSTGIATLVDQPGTTVQSTHPNDDPTICWADHSRLWGGLGRQDEGCLLRMAFDLSSKIRDKLVLVSS